MKKKVFSLFTAFVMIFVFVGVMPTMEVGAATNEEIRSKMISILYQNSGGSVTCDFDGYKTTPGRHEGIDCANYNGAPIYSLISGTVIRVNNSSSLSTLAIYDSQNNMSVIYLHSNIAVSDGSTVAQGQLIGYESNRGASASHTHVEVRNGRQGYAAKSVNDPNLENSNPYPYWEKVLFNPPPPPPDPNYNVPAYVTADHKINTYDQYGNIESNRYIDSGDNCYIEAVYTNGFVKVKYPTPSGDRWAYAKASDFDIPIVIPPTPVNEKYRVSTSSGANLRVRSTYSTSGSIVTEVANGTEFMISQKVNNWGYCDSLGGWLCLDYCTQIGPLIFTSSADSVSLNGFESKNVTFSYKNYNDGVKISWSHGDDEATRLSWGEWNNNNIDLNIKGYAKGTEKITVSLKDSNSDNVLATKTITVTVTGIDTKLNATSTSLSVSMDKNEKKCVTFSYEGVPAATKHMNIRWNHGDDKATTLEWSDWENNTVNLYITGYNPGTENIKIEFYDTDTKEVLATKTINVTVTCQHKFGNWSTTKAATCTSEGQESKSCSICGEKETRSVAKTGHKYDSKIVPSTFTEKGYTLHTCSVCSDSYKSNYTPVKITESVSEVVFLQQYFTKKCELTDDQLSAADLNCDGTVNVFDVIILKRRILKG